MGTDKYLMKKVKRREEKERQGAGRKEKKEGGRSPRETEALLWKRTDWAISGRLDTHIFYTHPQIHCSSFSFCILAPPVPLTGLPSHLPPPACPALGPSRGQLRVYPSHSSKHPPQSSPPGYLHGPRVPGIQRPQCREHVPSQFQLNTPPSR